MVLAAFSLGAFEDHHPIGEKDVEDLKMFFSTTYIERVAASTEITTSKCFKEGWKLFHFHHVCTRGGQDGFILGLEGVDNDWSHLAQETGKTDIFSADDWDRLIAGQCGIQCNVRHPLQALRINPKEVESIAVEGGSHLFQNCFEQELDSMNPAHWMMKLGTMFEIGQCQLETVRNGETHQIFRDPWPLPLNSFYMHQCPNPDVTNWQWGKLLYKIAEAALLDSGILHKNYRVKHDPGYQNLKPTINHPEVRPYGITCFADIYLTQRNGLWINKATDLVALRAESARLVGEPSQALREKEIDEDSQLMQSRPTYCPPRQSKRKSSARIHIFQRTATQMLRSFLNLNDVVTAAQSFTTVPVEVVTINASSTVEDQIRVFNDFDILITPHGSHLANGIFTMKPNSKGVIEVVSFAFDRVFYSNFNSHLGFGNYMLSTGHLTPPQRTSKGPHCAFNRTTAFKALGCQKLEHAYPDKVAQHFLECPTQYHTRMCDTQVDIPILKMHIKDMFDQVLCKDNLM